LHYLTLNQVLDLHERLLERFGGSAGVRDLGGLESALAQPQMTFAGEDLYPTIVEKASALAFSIIQNHPLVDGNKRVGHAAMEVFLILNGYETAASPDEQERVILQVASSQLRRDQFTEWLQEHVVQRASDSLS
jgi:death-on-curing protein